MANYADLKSQLASLDSKLDRYHTKTTTNLSLIHTQLTLVTEMLVNLSNQLENHILTDH